MTRLTELDAAVRELNELWQVCTDPAQGQKLLEKRDALDAQARELADKMIREGTEELNSAIEALNELKESAVSAKNEVADVARQIEKTADVIDSATTAITRVAALVA